MDPFFIEPDTYASNGKRFLNLIIDYAARFLLMVIAFFLIAVVSAVIGNNSMVDYIDNISRWEDILISWAFLLIYYISLEGLFGISLGKLITGTKVVTTEGNKLTLGNIIARSFCRLIPFNVFSGLVNAQFWHDSITNTVVVDKKKFNLLKANYEADKMNAPIYPSTAE